MIKIGFTKVEQKPQVEAIGITVHSLKGTNTYANTVISGRAVITEQEGFADDAVIHASNAQEEKDLENKVFLRTVTELKNLKLYATLAAPVGVSASNSTVALPVLGKAYTYKNGDTVFVLVNDNETTDKLEMMVETMSAAHPESGHLYDFVAVADGFGPCSVIVRLFRELTDVEGAKTR